MNYSIYNTDIKLGSIYPNESLNTEFKTFTFDSEMIEKIPDKNKLFHNLNTGIISREFLELNYKNILKYIEYYVPKYTTCFFNMDTNFSHSDSFFFIGIDDDGIIHGIPFDFNAINIDTLRRTIIYSIRKSIIENLFDNIVSKLDIISCIEPEIIIFNKSHKNFLDEKSKENKNKMKTEKEILKKLSIILLQEKKYKNKLEEMMNNVTVGKIKKKENLMVRLLNKIIFSPDFPIIYEKNNHKHINFLYNTMIHFDTTKYYKGYEKIIERYKNIGDYFFYNDIKKALGTFFHEQLKKYNEETKKNLLIKYDIAKKKYTKTEKEYLYHTEIYKTYFFNLTTYFSNLYKNPNNSYILIKIKFNNKKYNDLLKKHPDYIPSQPNLLSYLVLKTDERKYIKKQFVKSKRQFKYKEKNKLDPECKNLN
jgi:hypothetical protein